MVEGGKELIGKTISKRYRIIKMLGEGASAWVYLAEDTVNDTLVAIKVIRPSLAADGRFLKRFHNETTTLAKIRSPHAVKVLDHGTDDELEITHIVMEYIQGRTIARIVEEDGPLPVELALGIARQVALCLLRAQEEEIVHRDVKPANIMVTPDGMVKVMDFGIAKSLIKTGLTQTGVLGTPYYISPEQADAKPLDPRSDTYSLGCTLFHMLSGHPPFEGDNPVAVVMKSMTAPRPRVSDEREDVSEAVDEIVTKCMAKDREDRFWPAEFVAAIDSVMGEPEVVALRRPPLPQRELIEVQEKIHMLSAEVERLRSQIAAGVEGRRAIPRWTLVIIMLETLLLAVTCGVGYYLLRVQAVIPPDTSQLEARISALETASAAITPTPVVQSTDLYQQGVEAVQAGRYSEALVLLERAIELDPDYADAYYELGWVHFQLEQYDQAIPRFQKAVELKPDYLDADYGLAQSYYQLKEYNQAIPLYQKVIELNPQHVAAYNGLGWSYYQLRTYDAAIREFEQAIQLDPNNASAYRGLGHAYLALKMYDEAVPQFRQAIELDPQHVDANYGLAQSYYQLKEYNQAIPLYQKVIELNPQHVAAYNGLGWSYYRLESYDAAIREFEQAIELDPQYVSAYNGLGWTYHDLKQCDKATPYFRQVLILQPDHEGAQRGLEACGAE